MSHKVLMLLAALSVMMACKKKISFEEQCTREAMVYTNRMCPRAIAEDVVFDSMAYKAERNCMEYYYTMSGPLEDSAAIADGIPSFRDAMLKQVGASIDLKRYKDHNVTFRYVYYTKSEPKRTIIDMSFGPEEYK